jgi:citrate lyase subunit beta/citryl-CoA lyase
MPGSNARALEKARTLPADALILDLEDAVAPEAKTLARDKVCAAVREGFGKREVIVRINALDSAWGDDDLLAVAAAGPDGILLPKVSSARDIHRVEQHLAYTQQLRRIALWAMIETATGVLNLAAIAGADGQLAGLVLGSNDLIKEMGGRHTKDRANLLFALGHIVLAARAHGLAVIDGVHNDISDAEGFAFACDQAKSFGFDGKTLIHPSQIEPCNIAFAPSPADIAAAEKIVAAFARPENLGKGAIAVDGHMVERLHETAARKILALAQVIAAL